MAAHIIEKTRTTGESKDTFIGLKIDYLHIYKLCCEVPT